MTSLGDNWAEVTWHDTEDGDDENPGSEFYIQYRVKGECVWTFNAMTILTASHQINISDAGNDTWTTVTPDSDENMVNLTDLDPGEKYEVRVVARNQYDGEILETPSDVYVLDRPTKSQCDVIHYLRMAVVVIVCIDLRNHQGQLI